MAAIRLTGTAVSCLPRVMMDCDEWQRGRMGCDVVIA